MLVIFHKHIEMALIITIVTKKHYLSPEVFVQIVILFNACLSLKKYFMDMSY